MKKPSNKAIVRRLNAEPDGFLVKDDSTDERPPERVHKAGLGKLNSIYVLLRGQRWYVDVDRLALLDGTPADEPVFKFRPRRQVDPAAPTNNQRAKGGKAVLDAFSRTYNSKDTASDISDVISDLLHRADKMGLDALGILAQAQARWEEER